MSKQSLKYRQSFYACQMCSTEITKRNNDVINSISESSG